VKSVSEVRTALEDLDLSVRTWRNLKRSGIDTVEQLTALTMKKHWGKKILFHSRAVITEIATKLAEKNLVDFSSVIRDSGYPESELRQYQKYYM
jgi:DNA-directed RNA polymerase alpha subunit